MNKYEKIGMPDSSTEINRMSIKDIKRGPRISPFEIRDYAKKIAGGEMSEDQISQATNRKSDLVRWTSRRPADV